MSVPVTSPVSANRDLVHPNEDRATFNTAIFAAFVDALVVSDKTNSYHVLLLAAGAVHDFDVRHIVVSCDPQSGSSSERVRS